mgnify:CR=1 FL=1
MEMFDFRIINTPDGNQIIDRNLKTPYNALTPVDFAEYAEMDNKIFEMDRILKKREKKNKTIFHKLNFKRKVATF